MFICLAVLIYFNEILTSYFLTKNSKNLLYRLLFLFKTMLNCSFKNSFEIVVEAFRFMGIFVLILTVLSVFETKPIIFFPLSLAVAEDGRLIFEADVLRTLIFASLLKPPELVYISELFIFKFRLLRLLAVPVPSIFFDFEKLVFISEEAFSLISSNFILISNEYYNTMGDLKYKV